MNKKILIFSSNYLLAEGVRSILRTQIRDSLIQVFQKIEFAEENDFSVVIIDHNVLTDPCVYSLEKIRKYYLKAKLILLCNRTPLDEIVPYLDAFILASENAIHIQEKLNEILKDSLENSTKLSSDSVLSDREQEILRYVALGYTNRDISNKLSISAHTVITHRKNITAKLDIKTIAGLVVYAVIHGIITTDEMNA